MAQLIHSQAKLTAAVLTMSPASSGAGDTILPDDHAALLVRNGSTAAITMTVVVPGNTKYGLAQPDITTDSIPAGGLAVVGPFPQDLADPSDRYVHVTYSAVTSVDVAAIRV